MNQKDKLTAADKLKKDYFFTPFMKEFRPEYLDFVIKSIPNLVLKMMDIKRNAETWSGYYITDIRTKLIKSFRIQGAKDRKQYRKAEKMYGLRKFDKQFDKMVLWEEKQDYDKIEKLRPKVIVKLERLKNKIEKLRKKIKN